MSKTIKERQADFIRRAKEVHPNENIDYSEVIYINNRTPVKLIDHDLDDNGNEYGEFWQTPSNHLKGQSHPLKKHKKISTPQRLTREDFITRAKAIHKNENLDYSEVNYINMHTKVKIISHNIKPDGSEYGEFWQEPIVHLKGCTHPEIGKIKQIKARTLSQEEVIKRCKKVHEKANYDYSQVNYINNRTKIKIICNACNSKGIKHGAFEISPDNFMAGKGCPRCGNNLSIAEDEIIEYIKGLLPSTKIIHNDRTILEGKELDIYLPEKRIAIEYNGLKWHSEEYGKDRYYHLNKTLECEKKGVNLIHIFEDEYILHKEIVLSKISHILGCDIYKPKVYGRNVNVQLITNKVAKEFLNKNHIQGFVPSSIYLGAYYKEDLIGVMLFKNWNNGTWELTRFATDNHLICCGIGGKLFNYFLKNYSPIIVKSFADRRWTVNKDNNLYIKLGFKLDSIIKPDYRYVKSDIVNRFHKFNFRKQILLKKYPEQLNVNMTESEMTKQLGFHKIYDCGLFKYAWKNKI